ncbi:MAG: glutamine--fructose-6-phosphate transaminase (isomerizing) [Bacilli bacterium]
MCGIVGCIGKIDTKEYLLYGLETLDYRGYDSVGMAYLDHGHIKLLKTLGSVQNLKEMARDPIDSQLGIGHTRWATHGVPCVANAHPVQSMHKVVTLVHNGVIENFQSLKQDLLSKGYTFMGDTDSEVIADLIEDKLRANTSVSLVLQEVVQQLNGSFACVIIIDNDFDHLYVIKRSSPLLIAEGEGFYLLASDALPLVKYATKILDIPDDTIAIIEKDNCQLFNIGLEPIEKVFVTRDPNLVCRDLNGYPHYMLKEIEEIETVIRRLMITYHPGNHFAFDPKLIQSIQDSDSIIFLGCGTSYHASLVGARYFRHIGKTASTFIASEWAFYPQIMGKRPFIIMLSQSGETADLIHCFKVAKERELEVLLITNVKGSTLERQADYSIYLNAGLEISVASTKAYAAQVAALALLTNASQERHNIIRDLNDCCRVISEIRTDFKAKIRKMAEQLKDHHDIYFLGRGYDYDLSLEASLKLKEISYIHSEAIPGGELKHGPIALIEPGTPVLVFITDDVTASSMRNNVQEIKARGANVFVATTKKLAQPSDFFVVDDYKRYLSSVAISSLAFYFAYYVSVSKGLNVDKPRNLAKSVTVE